MRWPNFLIYGNWGGPGWSGGKFVTDPAQVDWSVPGIDAMDEVFKRHDAAWQTEAMSRKEADKYILSVLYKTNVKGTWSNIYRIGAIIGFWIMIRLPFRK